MLSGGEVAQEHLLQEAPRLPSPAPAQPLRGVPLHLEVDGLETLSCFHFPSTDRRRIRTTNGLERVNQEIKRRSQVVRIFPSPANCLRLANARLKEHHKDWITGRRYIDLSPLPEGSREGGGEDFDTLTPAA